MPQRALLVTLCAAAILGCGGKAAAISLGDTTAIVFDDRAPERTVVQVKIGRQACHPFKVAVVWENGTPTVVAGKSRAACSLPT
jgi:hypothetical protein